MSGLTHKNQMVTDAKTDGAVNVGIGCRRAQALGHGRLSVSTTARSVFTGDNGRPASSYLLL